MSFLKIAQRPLAAFLVQNPQLGVVKIGALFKNRLSDQTVGLRAKHEVIRE